MQNYRTSVRFVTFLKLAAILIAAVLTWRAFPPHSLGLFMLVTLVPMFVAVEFARNEREVFFLTWLWGFFSTVLVCWWVVPTIKNFTGAPSLVGWIGLFALAAFEQMPWAIALTTRFWVRKRGYDPIFFTPALVFALEWVWPKYFPNTMGNAFYSHTWFSQAADVASVLGLTFVVAASNEALASMIVRRSGWLKRLALTMLLVAVVSGYGAWRLDQVREFMETPSQRTRFVLVQPNVNSTEVVRAATNRDAAKTALLEQLLNFSSEALPLKPDFIFWPETAYPDTFFGETSFEKVETRERLNDWFIEATQRVAPKQLHLLFGARDQVGRGRYNALLMLSNSNVAARRLVYHKTKLLLGAEHIPFSDWFIEIAEFVRDRGGTAFLTGQGPMIWNSQAGVRLGPMICLEGLYPRYVREIANLGADILVNATNDAWFGWPGEPDLHLELTAFRSIETRRPIVRATNTGYSVVTDIDGSVKVKTNVLQPTVAAYDVPIYEAQKSISPYMRIGDGWFFLAAGFAAVHALRSRKKQAA